MIKKKKIVSFAIASAFCALAMILIAGQLRAGTADESGGAPVRKLYEVRSARSSAAYRPKQGYFSTSAQLAGVYVSLADGDVFTYNKPVDLKDVSGDVVRIGITPATNGEKDFGELFIVMTDAYDSGNYVIVSTRDRVGDSPTAYTGQSRMRAGAAHQPLTGYEGSTVHIANQFGFPTYLSFWGLPLSQNPSNLLAFRFDTDKQIITALPYSAGSDVVAGLADESAFKVPWNGFTTGEVFISVYAGSYYKSSANFLVTQIGNDSDFSGENVYVDTAPPVITVDLGAYGVSGLPQAQAGKPYPLFPARAFDLMDGERPVSVSVWRGGTQLSAGNNAFTPDIAGSYSIVYSALDLSGNEKQETLTVEAVNDLPPIILAVASSGRVKGGQIGEDISVSAIESASGGSGNLSLKIAVKGKSESFDIKQGETFRAFQTGVYTVIYTATDYIGNKSEYSYDILVTNGSCPIFSRRPVMPRYLIEGIKHFLPMVEARNFTNGSGAPVPVKIWVSDANGARFLDGRDYTPASGGKDVTIRYVAEIATGKSVLEYVLPTADVKENGEVKPERYFIGKRFSVLTKYDVLKKENYAEYTMTGNNAELEYINPLIAMSFSTTFALETLATAQGVDIYLTDAADSALQIKITLTREKDGSATAAVNDGIKKYAMKNASFTDNRDFSISYDDGLKSIVLDEKEERSVFLTQGLDGRSFNGFPSGKIYLSYVLRGASGSVKLRQKAINGQNFPESGSRVQIGYTRLFGDFKPGMPVTIPAAAAADIYDPYVKFTMSVIAPDKSTVVSSDGVPLLGVDPTRDYVIKLELYGDYVVTYSAVKSVGSEQNRIYLICSVGDTPPEITPDGNIIASVKAGDAVYVPKAKAVDASGGEVENVKTFVQTPAGVITTLDLSKNDGFIAALRGVYTIRYVACDRWGNLAVYEVKVTAA